MLKCKDISELVSRGLDLRLPWHLRLRMRFHFAICKSCSVYSRQLHFMHKALYEMEKHYSRMTLSESARQRIGRYLREYRKNLSDD